MKYKWDSMGDNQEQKTELSDLALDVLLKNLCTEEEYEDIKEDEELYAMRMKMVFDRVEKKFNYAKKRVTNVKGNSRVNFPREGGKYDDEAMLEMVRMELRGVFKSYFEENCLKGGVQKSNLNDAERRGLKSLQKRVRANEILVVPTDKSGRFAIMTLATYEMAGLAHTKKDVVVPFSEIKSTQTGLNGNVSMMSKIFKLGAEWNHGERMRESMVN